MNKNQKSLLVLGLIWIGASLLIMFAAKNGFVLGVIFLILGIILTCIALFVPRAAEKKKQADENQTHDNNIRTSQAEDAPSLFEMGLKYLQSQ